MKCYLPDNNPTLEEIEACTPYLDKQIEIIKPRIIITLGNIATTYILQKFGFKSESMFKIHGKIFQVNNLLLQAKIIPMYHPASALYNLGMKEILRTDWGNRKILFKTLI
ncbi:MAG: uracil-DNA glycosylase family protein [Candidatus Aenigmarchaeota archaeon]|nr:uracil-DNA glycosylase family protein [Candidatus Aenigmarchaeota archaeon]